MRTKPIVLAAALAVVVASPAGAAPRRTNWSAGAPVNITVNNDRFIPDRLTLARGRQYVLRIRNVSNRKHNFAAKTFFKYARVAPRDAAWVADNAVSLAPGQSATLHIFAPTTPNAVYEFRSTLLGDSVENMKGKIYVR